MTLPITLPQRQAYGSNRGRQSYASNFPGVEKEANLLCPFRLKNSDRGIKRAKYICLG
ncbi:MAG: hypothetical protein V7K69_31910 [Nostoc sp.]|uniref:hypothetical protein n=1 Tax=Nostoc sp. TaxID=1180 RepID=UPI002FF625A6